MSERWLTDLPSVLAGAGLNLGWQDGWQTRARSSGGYEFGGPWVVMWHHTAGAPGDSAWNAASYGSYSADARPIANAYVDNTGLVVIAAAGCTNTNGSGGPLTLPDGRVVPVDDMNRRAFGIELCNTGVGESYSSRQLDAAFALSNAIARGYIAGRVDNVAEHVLWSPGRKVDPATASAVEGSFQPRSVNSSGSWNTDDLRAECRRRASTSTPSIATAESEEAVIYFVSPDNESNPSLWASNVATKWLVKGTTMRDSMMAVQLVRLTACGMDEDTARGFNQVFLCDEGNFRAYGLAVGSDSDLSGRDAFGWHK